MLSPKKTLWKTYFIVDLMMVIDVVDVAAFIMNMVKQRKVQLGTTKTPYLLERREYLLVLHTINVHFCMIYGSTEPHKVLQTITFMSSIQNEMLKHCDGVPNPSLYGTKQVIHMCVFLSEIIFKLQLNVWNLCLACLESCAWIICFYISIWSTTTLVMVFVVNRFAYGFPCLFLCLYMHCHYKVVHAVRCL